MSDNLIKVLDHGYVRLVDSMGSDLSIVRAARVSYNAEWRTGDDSGSDERLLSYLLKNKHTSPFESVLFTFEIKCPIFIARQWHRHRTWSYNEVSARYTELPEEFYVPLPENVGMQSKDNKQVRDISVAVDNLSHGYYVAHTIRHLAQRAFVVYQELLSQGCPRELARSVLPVATYTRFFGTVDLHNLMHFLDLRLHSHAQYEIQQYALAIVALIKDVVPVTVRLKYGSEKN